MYTEYAPLVYNPITIFPRITEIEEITPISVEDLSRYLGVDNWVYWLTTPMILLLGIWFCNILGG